MFVLPGEAQPIDRIMGTFSDVYVRDNCPCQTPTASSTAAAAADAMSASEASRQIIAGATRVDASSSPSQSKGSSQGGMTGRSNVIAPARLPGRDAHHVLAFSVIMLNTDLYNNAIKDDKRMRPELGLDPPPRRLWHPLRVEVKREIKRP